MKLSFHSPAKLVDTSDIQDVAVQDAITGILRILEDMQKGMAITINTNEITYVAQNVQPSIADGQVLIWKDADAAVGQPAAYIVTQQDGVPYTFASVELA